LCRLFPFREFPRIFEDGQEYIVDSSSSRTAGTHPTQSNIEAIAQMEQTSLERRTAAERISDYVTRLVGNFEFLIVQSVALLAWCLVNLHFIPGIKPFDPFPFGILALLVSAESVFLTIFVLVRQSRMARQSERRSHLDLQVSMLSEQELTTIIQMLQKLCEHAGVNVDVSKQDVQSFSEVTEIHKIASDLEEKLPEE
jgi:uncharacterized membrane protein